MSLLALQSLEPGRVCAKRWRSDGTVDSYGSIVWWRPRERLDIASIDDLAAALERLEMRSDLCLVRGTLVDPTATRIRRAMQGDGAGLRDGDRSWLCMDLDTMEPPDDLRTKLRADPMGGLAAAGAWALSLMPIWLRDVSIVAQWSQSAGRDGYQKAKLHLWAWLDRPVCCASLAAWATDVEELDPAVCRPVQPIYTSRPIIEDGWALGPTRRTLLIRGAHDVATCPAELIDHATWTEQKRVRDLERAETARMYAEADKYRSPMARASRGARRMDTVVRKALDDMAAAPESRRHGTIVRCAAAIARTAYELGVDPSEDLGALCAVAVARLPGDRSHEPQVAIDYALRTL